jgi:hypothetical protein
MGCKTHPNFFTISFYNPQAIGQACGLLDGPQKSPLWLCRFDRITNHESPIRRASLAQGGPLTFHFSPFTNPSPSHFSLITSHLSRPRQRPSDLDRFAVPAAFRAARHLDQISGSGFEDIRIMISQ